MTDPSLRELLLSIATGGTEEFRVHKRRDVYTGEPTEVLRLGGERPGLWEELQTTIARLSKMSGSAGTGAHSAETPMPYHRKASEVAHRLANSVSTWARLIAEEYEHLTLTATTIPSAARWLATFPGLLAEHPGAVEMHRDILRDVRAAERVVDRAPDKVYVGPCHQPLTPEAIERGWSGETLLPGCCPEHLYATPGRDFVICRGCSTRYDVDERQGWLSGQLGPQLVTAAEAAPVLSWILDKEIKVDTIHKWRHRGRLAAHGERLGMPLYLFSEVETLAIEVKTRESKAKAKKEGSAA